MKEKHDIATQAARAAPALFGAAMADLTLNEWVAIATLVYVVIQAVYLVRKWVREETEWGRKMKRRS